MVSCSSTRRCRAAGNPPSRDTSSCSPPGRRPHGNRCARCSTRSASRRCGSAPRVRAAGSSWQKAAAIIENDFSPTFTVAGAEKDTRLICAAGASAGVRMDVMEAARERFRRAGLAGHADEDMAAAYFAAFTA
ncbi:NAD-binding protein [Actinoallomurus sp. NPDC052274]|uniref:NAD-binding protein n=1 Tax=Actinoallomurus sp. NPDC052274 TaxID=3155420 RepID=UPI0034171BA0